jgi:hypothetical protein
MDFLTFITAKCSLLKPLTIRKHFESVLNVMFNLNHIWYEEHKHLWYPVHHQDSKK